MSDLKPMTAADYRANALRVNARRPTEIVKLKSGSVFELRRPDLAAYTVTGRIPMTLLSEGLKAWKGGHSAEQALADADDQSMVDALVFMREIVHECTVRPKFVRFATSDDEISAAVMLVEDFNEIFRWAMGHKGVAGIDGLRTFPKRRKQRTSKNRARGEKLQPTPVSVTETESFVS